MEGDPPERAGHSLDAAAEVALERERWRRRGDPPAPARCRRGRRAGSPPFATNANRASAEREVALVRLHRSLDHAVGKLEEALVEAAPRERPATRRGRRPRRALRPGRSSSPRASSPSTIEPAALVGVGDHAGFCERPLVVGSVGELTDAGDEAMAVGGAARGNRLRPDLDRDRVVLGAQPADGPGKAELLGSTGPRHGLARAERRPRPATGARRASGGRPAPPDVVRREPSSSSTASPSPRAKPSAACVGFPSSNATASAGPRCSSPRCVGLEARRPRARAAVGPTSPRPARRRSAGEPALVQLCPRPTRQNGGGQLLAAELKQQRAHAAGFRCRARGRPAPRAARGRARARCSRRARSRRSRRARRAG